MATVAPLQDSDLLLQCFYGHATQRPNDVFLTQPVGPGHVTDYTFAQTLDQARRMAGHLRSLNLPPQSKIAVITKNCAHFFFSELAIWMAGHVTVALYPTLTRDTVSYILAHSEAKLLFVGKLDDWSEIQHGVPADLPAIAFPLAPATLYPKWDDIIAKATPVEGNPVRPADDHALIIYTSGSTGQPKGALHSFRTISIPTRGLVTMLQITKDDRMLSYLPLAHAMDRWLSGCVSLRSGCRIYFAESVDTFVKDLARARPTLFVSVPRLWLKFQLGVFKKMPPERLALLLKIPIVKGIIGKKILTGLGLDQVRFAGSGSAPIPADLISWYRSLGLELLEGYGMSENFNYSHLTKPGMGRPGYIGNPYSDVEHRISPEGEIQVKSPGTMVGYYKDPAQTAECFTEDGFLKTGDRGDIDELGRLRITGRVKELFKTSKGKYVAPVPIENMLNSDHHIELSLVAGSGQPATHAVVQLAEDLAKRTSDPAVRAEVTAAMEKLLNDINSKIEAYESMDFIAIAKAPWTIEGGQLTPTMKLKRTVIEKQFEPLLDGWYKARKKVIWQE